MSSLCVAFALPKWLFVLFSVSSVFLSGISGLVSLTCSHCSWFLHSLPKAPLLASSSAASFPGSSLCPLICSSLIFLFSHTCLRRVLAFAAKYLFVSALYSPVVTFAAYFES